MPKTYTSSFQLCAFLWRPVVFNMACRTPKVDMQLWWYTNIQVGNIQPPVFQLKEIKNVSLMLLIILQCVTAGGKKALFVLFSTLKNMFRFKSSQILKNGTVIISFFQNYGIWIKYYSVQLHYQKRETRKHWNKHLQTDHTEITKYSEYQEYPTKYSRCVFSEYLGVQQIFNKSSIITIIKALIIFLFPFS